MRKSWLGGAVSLAAHAAAISAVFFAQSLFRQNPVTVIDFSLPKTVVPPPPAPHPPVVRKPRPPVIDRRDVFPDTSKPDTVPPPAVDSAATAMAFEPPSAPATHGADASDSTVLKKEYLSAQYGVIRDKVYRALSYPARAQQEGWEGTVKMSFIVNRDGSVDSVLVLKSSGYKLLDNNAIRAIRQAAPFPYAPTRLQIRLPVVYRLE